MTTRFSFEVYDPRKNELYGPANIDLLLHLDGDVQMLTGEKMITGIVNVPELYVYQRSDLKDIKNNALAEDCLVKLTSLKTKQQIICILVWNTSRQAFELKGRHEGRDIVLPLTVDTILDYRLTRVGHIKTHRALWEEAERNGLSNSKDVG